MGAHGQRGGKQKGGGKRLHRFSSIGRGDLIAPESAGPEGLWKAVDMRTIIEQNKNIKGKGATMTDFLRELAAFTSMAIFFASFSVILFGI
jgi:hypothetical protein